MHVHRKIVISVWLLVNEWINFDYRKDNIFKKSIFLSKIPRPESEIFNETVFCLTCIYCYSTNKYGRNRHDETSKGPKKRQITRRFRCSCWQNSLKVDLPRYTTKDKQEERIGIHPCVDWFHLLYPCTGWVNGDVSYKFTRHGKWNAKPLKC